LVLNAICNCYKNHDLCGRWFCLGSMVLPFIPVFDFCARRAQKSNIKEDKEPPDRA
jgi:hypothetical protein